MHCQKSHIHSKKTIYMEEINEEGKAIEEIKEMQKIIIFF